MGYSRVGEICPSHAQFNVCRLHKRAAWTVALAACWVWWGLGSVQAAPGFGDLHGVTRNAQGNPLPSVQVSVRSLDDNSERIVVSNGQGAFCVDKVKPGRYQLKASKGGLASSAATAIRVEPEQDLGIDITLTSVRPSPGTENLTADSRAPASSAAPAEAPLTEREKLLLARLDQLEQRLAALEAQKRTSAAPATMVPANG